MDARAYQLSEWNPHEIQDVRFDSELLLQLLSSSDLAPPLSVPPRHSLASSLGCPRRSTSFYATALRYFDPLLIAIPSGRQET